MRKSPGEPGVRQRGAGGQRRVLGVAVVVLAPQLVRRISAFPGDRPSQRLVELDLVRHSRASRG